TRSTAPAYSPATAGAVRPAPRSASASTSARTGCACRPRCSPASCATERGAEPNAERPRKPASGAVPFPSSRLEGVAEHRADEAADHRDQDRVIAGLHPAIAAGRVVEAVSARVADHPVVGRIAVVETLAALPLAALDLADLDHLAAAVVAGHHPGLLAVADLLAAIVIAAVGGGCSRDGEDRSGGGGEDELLHFHSPVWRRRSALMEKWTPSVAHLSRQTGKSVAICIRRTVL